MTKSKKAKDMSVVRPIKFLEEEDKRPVKGAFLIPYLYSNLGLIAKTDSGKTTVIGHLLENTIDERTKVLIVSSTIHLDKAWRAIIAKLKKRKIETMCYDSMVDEEGVNIIDTFIRVLEKDANERKIQEEEAEAEGEEEKVERPVHPICMWPQSEEEKKEEQKKKKRKKVYKDQVPDYLLILDDMNAEDLRKNTIVNLVKKNRHYRMRCIISSQSLVHITPSAYAQFFQLFVWKGLNEDYMKTLYKKMSTLIPFETFFELYLLATKEKYSFLNIDLRENSFRVKFSKKKIFSA